jgi:hypothetical protein
LEKLKKDYEDKQKEYENKVVYYYGQTGMLHKRLLTNKHELHELSPELLELINHYGMHVLLEI